MNDPIAHAKSYPFEILDRSFTYHRGDVHAFDAARVDRHQRIPVLAAGSNQSHAQLHRKFGDLEAGAPVHAQRGVLHDFDVVYAAHLSSYGSVPATFQTSPGTEVSVFILWLDEVQLERMHATEGNYTYDRLSAVRIHFDDGDVLTDAYAYSSKVGCLNVGGDCVSLTEIAASGRLFRQMSQPEVQGHVRDRIADGAPLDAFIQAHLDDHDLRRERSAALGADALPLAFARETIEEL